MECCLFHQIKLKLFFYHCLSDASDGKESACNVGDTGSKPGSERSGRRDPEKGMATHPVFLPGESQEQRSLEGYNPWSCKESDTAE